MVNHASASLLLPDHPPLVRQMIPGLIDAGAAALALPAVDFVWHCKENKVVWERVAELVAPDTTETKVMEIFRFATAVRIDAMAREHFAALSIALRRSNWRCPCTVSARRCDDAEADVATQADVGASSKADDDAICAQQARADANKAYLALRRRWRKPEVESPNGLADVWLLPWRIRHVEVAVILLQEHLRRSAVIWATKLGYPFDRAEELAQEAIVRILAYERPIECVPAFFRQTTTNLLFSEWRAKRRSTGDPTQGRENASDDPETALMEAQLEELFWPTLKDRFAKVDQAATGKNVHRLVPLLDALEAAEGDRKKARAIYCSRFPDIPENTVSKRITRLLEHPVFVRTCQELGIRRTQWATEGEE